MTVRVENGVTYTQTWDYENRLVEVISGTQVTRFTYDADGALVKQETVSETTVYVGNHYEIQRSELESIDDFEYEDSPLNHGWTIYNPAGTVSTVGDAGRPGRVMRTTTSEGTGFGIKYPASGLLDLPYQRVSVWIKDTDHFYFYVRVHATNGSDYYIAYTPTSGAPYSSDNYAFIPIGSQYRDGTWRELNRDLSADLQSVFGVDVAYVRWFCIRGDYDLDDLVLFGSEVATRYYHFNGQRVAMRQLVEGQADVVYWLVGDHASSPRSELVAQPAWC